MTTTLVTSPANATTRNGELRQLAGLAGCVSNDGSGGCSDVSDMESAGSVALSTDGTSVYVATFGGGLAVFDRQVAHGADYGKVTQKSGSAGCLNVGGAFGCTDGRMIDGANDIVVSPDGLSVYASNKSDPGIAVFDRDDSGGSDNGKLTQKAGTTGCLTDGGFSGCGTTHDIDGPFTLAISADGTSLYSASGGSIGVFDRADDGVIVQKAATLGCMTFDGHAGACGVGNPADAFGPGAISVTADGKSVYAVSEDTVAVFDRDASGFSNNGALTQKSGPDGCLTPDGHGGACRSGRAITGVENAIPSPDGRSVYLGSEFAIAVFDRDMSPSTVGLLTQKSGTSGCLAAPVAMEASCAAGRWISGWAMAVAPDASSLYASYGGAVTVFDRNASRGTSNGALTQKPGVNGCLNRSGDDESGGPCRVIRTSTGSSTTGLFDLAVSPTGRSVYFAAGTGVVAFSRTVSKEYPCSIAQPTLRGTKVDDSLKGTIGEDIILGGDGNDTITGLDGSDVLCGEAGRDTLYGGLGNDSLDGGPGHDKCVGGPDADKAKSC